MRQPGSLCLEVGDFRLVAILSCMLSLGLSSFDSSYVVLRGNVCPTAKTDIEPAENLSRDLAGTAISACRMQAIACVTQPFASRQLYQTSPCGQSKMAAIKKQRNKVRSISKISIEKFQGYKEGPRPDIISFFFSYRPYYEAACLGPRASCFV
jgi:hypothetical protein